jgi:alkylation response protein AidB-like acyl-CoA dehydrogenase
MATLFSDELWPDVKKFIPDSATDVILSNAAASDRDAQIKDDTIEVLRNSRYFSSMIPAQFGGGGASLLECAAMQRRIGQVDAGLAIGLTMHMHSAWCVALWSADGIKDYADVLKRAAMQQSIICSAGAEDGLAGAARSSFLTKRTNEGYLLTGKKAPLSLARLGDYMWLSFANPDDSGGDPLGALAPLRNNGQIMPGLSFEKTWDTLGARSSESNSLLFQDYFVPKESVFAPSSLKSRSLEAVMASYCILLTCGYLGALTSALVEVRVALGGKKLHSKEVPRNGITCFISEFGEIASKVMLLECACAKVAEHSSERAADFSNVLRYAMGLKCAAVDLAREVIAGASELVGGASYGREHFLARSLRDIHAFPLHAPNKFIALRVLGEAMLGSKVDTSSFNYN